MKYLKKMFLEFFGIGGTFSLTFSKISIETYDQNLSKLDFQIISSMLSVVYSARPPTAYGHWLPPEYQRANISGEHGTPD